MLIENEASFARSLCHRWSTCFYFCVLIISVSLMWAALCACSMPCCPVLLTHRCFCVQVFRKYKWRMVFKVCIFTLVANVYPRQNTYTAVYYAIDVTARWYSFHTAAIRRVCGSFHVALYVHAARHVGHMWRPHRRAGKHVAIQTVLVIYRYMHYDELVAE